MAPSKKLPAMRCTVCVGMGVTGAWALKIPDSDGVRRCVGHSIEPAHVATRIANGEAGKEHGRIAADKHRGISQDLRKAVAAGIVDPMVARQLATKQVQRWEKQRAEPDVSGAEPIPLDTREKVLAFLAKVAGRLVAGKDGREAQAAAALGRTALVALGAELPDAEEGDKKPRGFSYVTTDGVTVAVRGRDETN